MTSGSGRARVRSIGETFAVEARETLPADTPPIAVAVSYDEYMHRTIVRVTMDPGKGPEHEWHCRQEFDDLDIFHATQDEVQEVRECVIESALMLAERVARDNGADPAA